VAAFATRRFSLRLETRREGADDLRTRGVGNDGRRVPKKPWEYVLGESPGTPVDGRKQWLVRSVQARLTVILLPSAGLDPGFGLDPA
jgi:hypothetical protein